jgi:hypothetical protein
MAKFVDSVSAFRKKRLARVKKSSISTLAKKRLTIETLEQRNLFAIEAFEAGSYIIDMGQSTQTVGNSLKPYGLVYSLVTDFKVPVQWAINPAKASFGFDTGGAVPIDFTATITSGNKDYRGGSLMIDKLAA